MGVVGSGVIGLGGTGFQLFKQSDNSDGIYADAAARNTYFSANPTELSRLDQNQFLIIKLLDGGSGSVVYQQRASSSWLDVTSLIQGNTGPAGATGNSYFFESISARDAFFNISPNEALLQNGLPVVVNIGDFTQSTYIWGGASTPVAYDATLWRLSASEISSGTLFLGVGGAGVSSGSELLNFTAADGDTSYLHGIMYDDTGSNEPMFWKLPAISSIPLADVSSATLTDPQAIGTTNTMNAYVKEYTLIPATAGTLRVQTWLGTDETGAELVDTYTTVEVGDIGNQTTFTAPNNTLVKVGQQTYTKFSGVQLKGGLQTSGTWAGQTTPFITLGAWVASQSYFVTTDDSASNDSGILYFDGTTNEVTSSSRFCYFDTTDVTNVSIHSGTASGQANLIFRDNGAGNKGYLRYDETLDAMRLFTLSDVNIEITPGAGGKVGINKSVPTSTLSIYENTSNSDSSTGVVIEQDGTGNALLQLLTTGIKRWVVGIDNTGTAATSDLVIGDNTDLSDASRAITINHDSQVAIGMFPAASSMSKVLTVYHDHATEEADILIQQDGAGDAVLEWLIPGRRWSAGIDNSDSDKWMLSPSNGLADSIMTVTTDGKVGINILSPTSGIHLYENNTSTDDSTGIKIEQDGTGDASLHLQITGGDEWSIGIDQSDSERLKIAPNDDVGSSSVIDFSSTDINFLSDRTNLANTSTTTFLTMNSPTATGLTGILFHDNLTSLHGSVAYNHNVDQLQINSVFGDIVMFAGNGLTEIDSGNATRNYIKMSTTGASSTTGLQVENVSTIDLEVVYDQSADKSHIINRSANGLELESVTGDVKVKSTASDIILDLNSTSGRVEITGVNHEDTHSILNIVNSDGDVDFYVGTDTPVGNTSASGGSFYFRDDELDTGLFMKRSSGAPSTSGWVEFGDISGPASSVDNALVTFDGTTGKIIQQSSGITAITTASVSEMVFTSPSATGGCAIEFYDNAAALKFSLIHNDSTNENHLVSDEELTIQAVGAALNITSGDDMTINANSGANLITVNDDFVFSDTATDAILSIKTPSATATAGITLQNNASTAELELEYNQNTDVASIILHNEVPLSITGADHDEDDILLTLASQGTNGAQTSMTVSDRTPVGNNTANPGSQHTTVDGVNSGEWIHEGASADSTSWKKKLTKDERTLVYSIDVDGIDENEFIFIGEYRVVATGRTGDYGNDYACNNQHTSIEVNSITGSGVVTFTGVSMSESSGIPTATTETITVDAIGKYQTDKKWLEITNIDIPVGITAINYDVEVLGYLDMQNSDFTVTGMRIDGLSNGNDADFLLGIIKVQDNGSKKCELVDIEAYGYDAKDDLIVDELRTGGDDRSYTATTALWANGTNACLKASDYSTYFTSDENVIEGASKAEGIIIHFIGTDDGNLKHISTLNLHLTIEMN